MYFGTVRQAMKTTSVHGIQLYPSKLNKTVPAAVCFRSKQFSYTTAVSDAQKDAAERPIKFIDVHMRFSVVNVNLKSPQHTVRRDKCSVDTRHSRAHLTQNGVIPTRQSGWTGFVLHVSGPIRFHFVGTTSRSRVIESDRRC